MISDWGLDVGDSDTDRRRFREYSEPEAVQYEAWVKRHSREDAYGEEPWDKEEEE